MMAHINRENADNVDLPPERTDCLFTLGFLWYGTYRITFHITSKRSDFRSAAYRIAAALCKQHHRSGMKIAMLRMNMV